MFFLVNSVLNINFIKQTTFPGWCTLVGWTESKMDIEKVSISTGASPPQMDLCVKLSNWQFAQVSVVWNSEEMHKSMEMFEYQTGLKGRGGKLPTVHNNSHPIPTQDEIEEIERLMPIDMYFYKYAKQLFHHRWNWYQRNIKNNTSVDPEKDFGKTDSSRSYWWLYKFSQIFEVWRWVSSFKQNSNWFVSLIQHQNHTGAIFLVKNNQEKFKMTCWEKQKGRTNGIQILMHTVKEEESCFVTLYWNKLQSQWGIFLTFHKRKIIRCCWFAASSETNKRNLLNSHVHTTGINRQVVSSIHVQPSTSSIQVKLLVFTPRCGLSEVFTWPALRNRVEQSDVVWMLCAAFMFVVFRLHTFQTVKQSKRLIGYGFPQCVWWRLHSCKLKIGFVLAGTQRLLTWCPDKK